MDEKVIDGIKEWLLEWEGKNTAAPIEWMLVLNVHLGSMSHCAYEWRFDNAECAANFGLKLYRGLTLKIAAVAITMIRLYDQCMGRVSIDNIFQDIRAERKRQDEIWGEQNHDPVVWCGILSEEIGEVAKEVNENYFGRAQNMGSYRTELIQVAAVAVNMVESYDRGKWVKG